MPNPGRKHTGRGGDTNKSKTTSRNKPSRNKPGPEGIREPGGKLDKVSDAPESGEPREQGRSRGRIVET